MSARLEVKGVDAVRKALVMLARQMPVEAARALNVIAEETMTNAKERTPVLTGTLRRSGKVHERAKPNSLKAGLSFGTEYGVFVHERTDLRHTNGEAKFLENAIKFTATFFLERMANELQIGGRGTGAGSPGGTGSL